MLLPEAPVPSVLMIDPYLTAPLSNEHLLELGEKCGVSPSRQSRFSEYFEGIPVLPEGNHLFIMINTFCERIWKRLSFAIVDVNQNHHISASPINKPLQADSLDDVLMNMKTMEKRYAFENELIRAVSPGYLSSIFKKDTGKTLSEYIREKRINHTDHLLATTNLQIQTIALHCGIMDVHHFSKTFKKVMGKTPKEYREYIRKPEKNIN